MQSLITSILRHYKRWISPMMAPHCRFYPSCSSYAIEAIETHGMLRGSYLTITRVLRCNPCFAGGVDPVPGCCESAVSEQNNQGAAR